MRSHAWAHLHSCSTASHIYHVFFELFQAAVDTEYRNRFVSRIRGIGSSGTERETWIFFPTEFLYLGTESPSLPHATRFYIHGNLCLN